MEKAYLPCGIQIQLKITTTVDQYATSSLIVNLPLATPVFQPHCVMFCVTASVFLIMMIYLLDSPLPVESIF